MSTDRILQWLPVLRSNEYQHPGFQIAFSVSINVSAARHASSLSRFFLLFLCRRPVWRCVSYKPVGRAAFTVFDKGCHKLSHSEDTRNENQNAAIESND
jgi:hypothetical protein